MDNEPHPFNSNGVFDPEAPFESLQNIGAWLDQDLSNANYDLNLDLDQFLSNGCSNAIADNAAEWNQPLGSVATNYAARANGFAPTTFTLDDNIEANASLDRSAAIADQTNVAVEPVILFPTDNNVNWGLLGDSQEQAAKQPMPQKDEAAYNGRPFTSSSSTAATAIITTSRHPDPSPLPSPPAAGKRGRKRKAEATAAKDSAAPPRKKAKSACQRCKDHKLGCDNGEAGCNNCRKAGTPCEMLDPISNTVYVRGRSIQSLERELAARTAERDALMLELEREKELRMQLESKVEMAGGL